MFKRLLLFSVLFLFLNACMVDSVLTPRSMVGTPTHQPNEENSRTPTISPTLPTAANTQAATSTPTLMLVPLTVTPIPTLAPISPDVVSLCPEVPEVSLEKFELEDFYLIVHPYAPNLGEMDLQASGAVVIPLDHPVPQVITGSNGREGWDLIDTKIAEDGTSVEMVYIENNGDRRQVWRSSWDGKQQWLVAEFNLPPLPPPSDDFMLYYYYDRIDENWYAAYKSDLETNTHYPIFLYNHSTGEKRDIPPFSDGTFVRTFLGMEGDLYMIYYQGQDIDFVRLYNLETNSEVPIFQWLNGRDESYSLNTFWFYRDGKFTVEVIRNYGVDLGVDLDLDTAMANETYDEVMQAFYLPGDETGLLAGGFLEKPNRYFYERNSPRTDITTVYQLELSDFFVNEFCYTVGNFTSTLLYATSSVSPDDRFVAYTHIKFGIGDEPDRISKVEILDLVTGEYAKLPDANYEVIDWGRK